MNKPATDSNKGIIIRTEGGGKIGMGHIMRSLSIAHVIRERGIPVSFIVNQDKAALDAVILAGYIAETNIESLLDKDISITAAIFDLKRDVSGEIQNFRNRNIQVVMIDNRTLAADAADLIIIPSLVKTCKTISADKGRNYLEGAEYFPLNHNFFNIARTPKSSTGSVLRILVTMGGSDPNNLTPFILEALQEIEGIEVRTVIGPSMEMTEDLMKLDNGSFIYNADVNKMALLMNDSDIAFTAFGITLFELAYMGVPSIVIANYREDKEDMDAFKDLGIGIPLGHHEDVKIGDIKESIKLFLNNRELHLQMSETGKKLVDGHGADRIVKVIENIGINFALTGQECLTQKCENH